MKKVEKQILEEIKRAERILLHLHLGPDGDSIGSVFAMWRWLKKLGKEVTVVSFDPIPEEFHFLEEVKKVKKADVAKLDFFRFDLWLSLDSSDWNMISKKADFRPPENLMLINIDHHVTNTNYGKINLVLPEKSSVAEILFDLFEEWSVKIDAVIATLIFLGVFTDTGGFFFLNTSPRTMRIGAKLMELGADKEEIISRIYRGKKLKTLKYWGKILENLRLDKKRRMLISAVPYEVFKELILTKEEAVGAASSFLPIVEDADFGVLLEEDKPQDVRGNLRSRTDFDVSKIATAMGGGGHKAAAGFRTKGDLKSVEGKLLKVIRELT